MLQPLRVLLIEDSVDDAELLLHELRHGGYDVHWQRVETADALRTALMDPWDVVISDYTLPEFSAMQALGLVKEHDRDLPFIITSETVGEETAVAAMKAGAHDYIVKGHWARLVPAIARELSEARVRRERKQAQKELEAYARNLILLNDITRAASGILDFNQMLQVLADRLGELLDADGCFLTLWDEKKQAPIPAAAYGSLRNSYAEVAVEQDEATLTGHVLKTGKVLAIEDTEKTPYLSLRLAAMFPSRAILALPLIVAEQKLGAALISFDKPYIFSQDEISRGEQAAGQIALAVAKAQLLDAERKQRELAETLREVTHVLTSSLDQAQVLDLILDQLARVITYDSASVYDLVGKELHRLIVRTVHEQTDNPILPIEQFKHIVEVLSSRKTVIIDDTFSDPRWQSLSGKPHIGCWIGVPLIAHNEVIGLLNVTHAKAHFYDQPDAEIVMAIANQAATAIENARLYERLRNHAEDLETEVTERTRELAKANEQLKELDRLKTKFVSDVSHELRTPVTNLKLYLSLIDRGAPQQRERYLAVINQQTTRLEELIKAILDISSLERDVDQIVFQPVNLNELVERTIQLHTQRAELAGLQLEFQPAPSLPLVSGDDTRLRQVTENLITNALYYTINGSVRVKTFADLEQKKVCLQVVDTGMGIAEKEIPLLFDRFYRGERTSQLNIPGTGLGLSIVQEIVKMHHGRIEVKSEVNKGSTFWVWLPISSATERGNHGETTSMA
jgi:signal transduction histidine kinase/DNA-binding response OmpR family regulator